MVKKATGSFPISDSPLIQTHTFRPHAYIGKNLRESTKAQGGIFLLSKQEFITHSVQLNLFFQRIMKEHLFLTAVNLPAAAAQYSKEAKRQQEAFAALMTELLPYANGVISNAALQSREMVTPYTFMAEEVTASLTGSAINTDITKKEFLLKNAGGAIDTDQLYPIMNDLNNRSLTQVKQTVAFQTDLLNQVNDCKIFINIYPQMLHHMIEEAEHYLQMLAQLQNNAPAKQNLEEELHFWNHIMKEHAGFLDGMLDPSETKRKDTAEDLEDDFVDLHKEAAYQSPAQMIAESTEATREIKAFKTQTTEGLLECEIKSIIPAILSDHLLREANHYLRLLAQWK